KPKPEGGEVDDPFIPLHPTSGSIFITAEENYLFLPLWASHDRKYRVVRSVNHGDGWTEVWQGFIAPVAYNQDLRISQPYVLEIPVRDNIQKLSEIRFADDNGNFLTGRMSLIKIIAFALSKTGLNLKIRAGINIFETRMDTTESDDPLAQTYVDVSCYQKLEDDKVVSFFCSEVLTEILRPFGARLVQGEGMWIIEEIKRASAPYAYRIFNSDGEYESNGVTDHIIDAKNASEEDRAVPISVPSLGINTAYGRIKIVSKFNYIGSIISGGFEKTDLLSPDSE